MPDNITPIDPVPIRYCPGCHKRVRGSYKVRDKAKPTYGTIIPRVYHPGHFNKGKPAPWLRRKAYGFPTWAVEIRRLSSMVVKDQDNRSK